MSTPYARTKAMAKAAGCKVKDLLVLAEKNDPFYSGSPANRVKAQWFADLWSRFGYTSGVHLRRVHYQLGSLKDARRHDGKPYRFDDSTCWDTLLDAGKHARHLGLVDAAAFVDRRNPDPTINMHGEAVERTFQVTLPYDWGYMPEISVDFSYSVGRPTTEIFGYHCSGEMQPYLIEVWCEKSTMNDILKPLCEKHCVNLVTGAGFMSITSAIELISRVKKIGKPTRILFISDFDPAGAGMPVAVARQLEYWCGCLGAGEVDLKLIPIILTADQVAEYDLPRAPIKKSDRRAGNFEAVHGEGAVELDALEALHPGEFKRIVEGHILRYRDPSLRSRTSDALNLAYERVDAALEDAIGFELEQIATIEEAVTGVLGKYRDRVHALNAEMQAELEPYKSELETLRLAVEDAAGEICAELPPLPAPIEVDDGGGWLYDNRRPYLEQLAVYKAHVGAGDAREEVRV